MLVRIIDAWCLLAISVVIHALGLTTLILALRRSPKFMDTRFWRSIWLLIRLAWGMIVIHLAEIVLWALFYSWQKCLPDLQSSIYFSVVTYTTVGYGDLVLPGEWRILGGVEALTGILMCGWSTAFLFAFVSRRFATLFKDEPG